MANGTDHRKTLELRRGGNPSSSIVESSHQAVARQRQGARSTTRRDETSLSRETNSSGAEQHEGGNMDRAVPREGQGSDGADGPNGKALGKVKELLDFAALPEDSVAQIGRAHV